MSIEEDVRKAVLKYSDMLYKICIVILCNMTGKAHAALPVLPRCFGVEKLTIP